MYGNARDETRLHFFTAWKNFKAGLSLSDFEQQLVQVIIDHPEYQFIFDNPEKYERQEYFPELGQTNPFMHLGLHLAIRDQIGTDRPEGIRNLYFKALSKQLDPLDLEHQMIEVLGLQLWEAMHNQSSEFDTAIYIERLREKLK